jgi:sigma-B regulation protein RsbU (phosphoserine phosphatase)
MGKTALLNQSEVLKRFTDVLYLTNNGHNIPIEVKRLLKQNKLSFMVLPIDKFSQIRGRVGLIGTVIIDADESTTSQATAGFEPDIGELSRAEAQTRMKSAEVSPKSNGAQQWQLARIIESLEMEGVGVILLTKRTETPIKSFSLAPSNSSFSRTNSMKSIDTDELWLNISLNLAYRKKSPGIAVKPVLATNQIENSQRADKNTLGQQLQMAGTLVDNLAEQLRMAGRVQRDFLPAQLPNCDELQWATIFLPAEWVSGDIYDVVRIDEQHFGFYVADAVGHAMPAALLTIFVKQALVMRETYESNYKIFSPAEVIKNLNVRLTSQKLSGYQFATCCYCLLNIKTMQLTFARAGHPYPVLIRPGRQPEQLESRGSLLGVFENADYIQQTVQLQSGDKLLLYSDGAEPFIGEFDDMTGFHFNEEFRRIADLPVVEMMDGFNSLVHNQTVRPSEVDDITAVGLQIL